MIKRPDYTNQRVLPEISDAFYLSKQNCPIEILGEILGPASLNFSPWQAFRGRRKDPKGPIARLLCHHEMAVEAERAEKFNRADFYWKRLYAILNRSMANQTLLGTLDSELLRINKPQFKNSAALFQVLINELFIDTHCAFYNGIMQGTTSITLGNRMLVHIAHIKDLINMGQMPREAQKKLLDPIYRALCNRHKLHNDPSSAVRVLEEAIERFPDDLDYQDELCGLYVSDTIEELSGNSTDRLECLSDAMVLEEGIKRLERFRHDFPCNVICYQMLGELHHLHSAKLANSELYAEALLAVEKALAFNPLLTKARENKEKLVKMMNDLQAQMQEIMAQLSRGPGKALNEAGLRLMKQTTQGFKPVNDFIESEAAGKIQEELFGAYARRNWISIGLSVPEENWDQIAGQLVEAVHTILDNPPRNEHDIKAAWEDAVSGREHLSELDAGAICVYLGRRILDSGGDAGDPKEELNATGQSYPIITTAPSETLPDHEPFSNWLLSGQDWRLKLQAIIAMTLIVIACVSAIQSRAGRTHRNSAYARIVGASLNKDYPEVIRQSEIFLSNRPLSGRDIREPKVMGLYNEAIVRWIMQTKNKVDKNAMDHIQRYRDLAKDRDYEVQS